MARIRSDAKRLAELLSKSGTPIYALDDRRRIIFCNDACTAWLGLQAEQLLGIRCDYHSEPGQHSASDPPFENVMALSPPPEAFLGGCLEQQVVYRTPAGPISRRSVRFVSLGDGANCVGVVAVVSDVDQPELVGPLTSTATSALLHERLQQIAHTQRGLHRLDPWAGDGIAMRRVREQVRVAIDSQASLAVIGPGGAGKEFLARAIHQAKDLQHSLSLLPLSCSLLDAESLQATILAFLRREQDGPEAAPPTLLLLEADQLSPAGQLELLGFVRLPTIELRILATAETSLVELSGQDQFNVELAVGLSSLEIILPRLADRREDIPLLAQRIVEAFNQQGGKQVGGCSAAVLDLLGAMPWERNLDELTEVLQHAWNASKGPLIEDSDLPPRVRLLQSAAEFPLPVEEPVNLDEFLREVEEELIIRALRKSQGNKSQAARTLGIQRARLLRRMAQLGVTDGVGRE